MAVGRTRAGQPAGPDSPIPDKLYFKIGEVAQLVGVQAHVLRYWEKEISAIRPGKSVSNQRRYRRKDVEIFREVRRLLYAERYTLAGARRRILAGEPASRDNHKAAGMAPVSPPDAEQLRLPALSARPDVDKERLRRGLIDIIRLVGEEP